MPWIARDKTGKNEYRLFGAKPVRLLMVSYEGEVMPEQSTWTLPGSETVSRSGKTYRPLANREPTTLSPADSPIELEPGEGPCEVSLSLVAHPKPRLFEGSFI